MIEDFSTETMELRRKWHIFQVLKEISCQSRILYPVKLSFIKEGKINTFSKRVKLDFPIGAMDKNLPANAGDTGSILGLEDSICCRATKPVHHNH